MQNERLDRFHVKDNMHQVVQDIQGGRILQVRMPAPVTTVSDTGVRRQQRFIALVATACSQQLHNHYHSNSEPSCFLCFTDSLRHFACCCVGSCRCGCH